MPKAGSENGAWNFFTPSLLGSWQVTCGTGEKSTCIRSCWATLNNSGALPQRASLTVVFRSQKRNTPTYYCIICSPPSQHRSADVIAEERRKRFWNHFGHPLSRLSQSTSESFSTYQFTINHYVVGIRKMYGLLKIMWDVGADLSCIVLPTPLLSVFNIRVLGVDDESKARSLNLCCVIPTINTDNDWWGPERVSVYRYKANHPLKYLKHILFDTL